MNNLHPVFQSILRPYMPKVQSEQEQKDEVFNLSFKAAAGAAVCCKECFREGEGLKEMEEIDAEYRELSFKGDGTAPADYEPAWKKFRCPNCGEEITIEY
jgi:hypothetical protein